MSQLVTVITPCLNSEKTIERTIISVLSQTYKNIQYLVIDGKSTDRTLEILQKYQQVDPRLRVVSEKDNSMTEALNRGLRLAEGEIIATLNADDWYELGTVEEVVQVYQIQTFPCLMANTQFVSESGELLYVSKPWLANWLPAWLIMGCLTPESSVFYSASCVKEIGYFNEKLKYTQDFEYYLRILKTHSISYVDKTLSNFTVGTNQYSTRFHKQMEAEVLSYLRYKHLRKLFGGSSFGSIVRVLLGVRSYRARELINHLVRFSSKNLLPKNINH